MDAHATEYQSLVLEEPVTHAEQMFITASLFKLLGYSHAVHFDRAAGAIHFRPPLTAFQVNCVIGTVCPLLESHHKITIDREEAIKHDAVLIIINEIMTFKITHVISVDHTTRKEITVGFKPALRHSEFYLIVQALKSKGITIT